MHSHEGVVRQLIAAGANVHHKTKEQWTPLLYAAWKGYVASARQLLAGADMNAVETFECTPLDLARRHEPLRPHTLAVPVEYSTLEVAWVVALADLHNAGLLHRDLKSHNVLLSSTSYFKVADLGSARDDTSTMTAGVGTPHWMAPEVRAYGAKYDASADIYSFGVILTELNTFQVLYADVTMPPLQLMSEVAAGRLRPSLRADCPT
ncbi:protein kinase [Achlya hypogyna]|uniref:Protein kinase n=1 Tax=Achlya hypogyna TaxID=1202772 RepID=A0A1V9YSR0_ACHHY|nr:protein kinase [Achlya hypogyna]